MPKIRIFWNDAKHSAEEETTLMASSVLPDAALAIINNFNRTIRPYEIEREFVSFEIIDEDLHKHEWEKSSLVTERGGYDKMKCAYCGATGKRYGLGQESPIPDKPFTKDCKIPMRTMAMPKRKP